jgi:hypothetical protein
MAMNIHRPIHAWSCSAVAALVIIIGLHAADAQVLIDMPPAINKKSAEAPAAAARHPDTPTDSAAAASTNALNSAPTNGRYAAHSYGRYYKNPPPMDLGDIALARYSRARTFPYDTYNNAPYYTGIRQYGYPFPLFWWGFWPFFPPFICVN